MPALYQPSLIEEGTYTLVVSLGVRRQAPKTLKFKRATCQQCHVIPCECAVLRARARLRWHNKRWFEKE
jgi:hypothetical protein